MARRTDIRRIGSIMRRRGADGSLVAWVEAELDRVDFANPAPGCLTSLVEDLVAQERQAIVAALLLLAMEAEAVDDAGLEAAIRLGTELGIEPRSVERVMQEVSGWSMKQARELARLELPASISPAALAEAKKQAQPKRGPKPPPPAATLIDDLDGSLDEVPIRAARGDDELVFEIPDLTLSDDQTDPYPSALASPPPMASGYDTDKVPAEVEPQDDGLGEDPPTVEMTKDAVKALLDRKTGPGKAAPPRFSPLGENLGRGGAHDGPTALGLEAEHEQRLANAFDTEMNRRPPRADGPQPLQPMDDLAPIDWGENDAFTISDFTLSERIAGERFDAEPFVEEPTLHVQIPSEVQELQGREAGAGDAPLGRRDATVEIADQRDDDPTGDGPPVPGRTHEDDLELDDEPEQAVDEVVDDAEDLDLDPEDDSLPGPIRGELDLRGGFLAPPATNIWEGRGPDTQELLDLDLDDAPDDAFARALRSTGPLPPIADEPFLAAPIPEPELSLDDDEPELSLDPDTGERIAVARGRAVPWAPPESSRAPTGLPSADEDILTPDLQPLEEGLAAYWAPQALHLSDGLTGELRPVDDNDGLTGELRIIEPGDVQGGLTGELRVIDPGDVQGGLTGELRAILPGEVEEGLTGELRFLPEESAPRRQTRRGQRREAGITQDLTLLVDGDPKRRKD